MHLTEAEIAKLEAPAKGQKLVFDEHRDAPIGFGVRITEKGAKSFIYRYTHQGIQRRMTLGKFDPERPAKSLTLAKARKKAKDLRKSVENGVDVLGKQHEAREDLTVTQLVAEYLSGAAAKKRSYAEIKRVLEKGLVPELGGKKAKSVTRRDVRELVKSKLDTPASARQLYRHIHRLYSWALGEDLVDAQPAAGIKLTDLDESLAPKQRGRVLTDDEVAAFWRGINSDDFTGMATPMKILLQLVLVTGQRPGEVARLREDQLNDDDVWVIPGDVAKNEQANAVPLTDVAQQLIEEAREYRRKVNAGRKKKKKEPIDSPYLLLGPRGEIYDKASISRAVSRNREALGNQNHPVWGHWTPHDLRRTVRTALPAHGISSEIAERVINHKKSGVQAVYDVYEYIDEKRKALWAWDSQLQWCLHKTRDAEPDNVVKFERSQ